MIWARRVVSRVAFGIIAVPTMGIIGYAQIEPGFKRELQFWKHALVPIAHYSFNRYVYGKNADYQSLHAKYAPASLACIQELGGLFIKAGQVASTRPEFVPQKYREMFRQLQSEVESQYSFDDLREVIELELGKKLEDVFSEFEKVPIGTASIGQAYLARLRDTNEQVVVKIQYPDADWKFRADIRVLGHFTNLVMPEANLAHEEFARQFLMELDYVAEGRNMQDIFDSVSDKYQGRIIFPKLFPEQSSKRMITMTYIPGEMLENEVRRRLAEAGIMPSAGELKKNLFSAKGGRLDSSTSNLPHESYSSSTLTDDQKENNKDKHDDSNTSLCRDSSEFQEETALQVQANHEIQNNSKIITSHGAISDHESSTSTISSSMRRQVVNTVGLNSILRSARFMIWMTNMWKKMSLMIYSAIAPVLRLLPPTNVSQQLDKWFLEELAEQEKRRAMNFTNETIDLLLDVHGFQIFRVRIFNGDPHPGNILLTPDQQIGLIDYGQCKRLSQKEAENLAQLIVAIDDGANDDIVANSMRACGFKSKYDNSAFLANFGRLIFSRLEPYMLDRDWHHRFHKQDKLLKFPQSAIMVARCSGILRGIGLSYFHNVNVAKLWAPHARACLKQSVTS